MQKRDQAAFDDALDKQRVLNVSFAAKPSVSLIPIQPRPKLYLALGAVSVVPPKSNRIDPSSYNEELYKKRNEIERLFRRLKGFRRIFSQLEKLDVVFLTFIHFPLIVEAVRIEISVNAP